MHKYLLKVFYGRTNKKEYELQILKHNIYYINIIAWQDAILITKILVGSTKKKKLVVDTFDKRSYTGMQFNKCFIEV